MAEKTVLVCDRCGGDGAERVHLAVGTRRLVTELCSTHLRELTSAARPLPRGRRARSAGPKTSPGRPQPKASTGKRRSSLAKTRTRATRARQATGRSTQSSGVAAAVNELRSQGLSYREVGEALMKRGIKPKRAARWNPIVLARMVKKSAAA
jgi:hypothetical protein